VNRTTFTIGIALTLLVFTTRVQATAQIPDQIIIEGVSHSLHAEPFSPYVSIIPMQFHGRCTASWRGYRATWEIIEKKLYLLSIHVSPCSKSPPQVPLKTIFPNDPVRKFADWHSGVITVAQGQLVKPIYGGYASKYERYLELTIKDGVVIKEDRHDMAEEERREKARWQKLLSENKGVAAEWKKFSEILNKPD
jgi:hypothetical protein